MSSVKKNKTSQLFWRIAISAVGLCLIAIALGSLLVFFIGDSAPVSVKTRRIGGSKDGMSPENRYEWSLDYSFTDKKGKVINGTTTRRGSDMSVRTDSRVYYLSFAPYISFLESDAQPNISQPLFIVLGVFLIYVMNHRRKKKRRSSVTVRGPSDINDYDDSIEEQFHEDT